MRRPESWCSFITLLWSVSTVNPSDRPQIKVAPFHTVCSLLNTSHFCHYSDFLPSPSWLSSKQTSLVPFCYFALHQRCRKMIQDVTHRNLYSWPPKTLFLHNTFVACSLYTASTKARDLLRSGRKSRLLTFISFRSLWKKKPLNVIDLCSLYGSKCKASTVGHKWSRIP